jgi:hypothetical protein
MDDHLGPPENPAERRLAELDEWWLEIRCSCPRRIYYPLRLMVSKHSPRTTLGDVLPRLRCEGCGSKPVTLALVNDPSRGEMGKPYGPPWMRVMLRGE